MTIRWPEDDAGPGQEAAALLEEIDALLVQQLQRDGRASFQALGRAVGLTRTAARARVSRLLDRGVIEVVALPDAAVTGQAVVAHLSADVTGSALAAAHAIASLPSVVFVSVTSGQFPVIADLRSPGEAALAADLDRLRSLPGIRGIEVVRALTLVRDAYRPRPGHQAVNTDEVDRLLISGLERDGRMTYAELAALAGLSAAATRSRVLRLIRGGAVHVTVLVDARHTGRLARAGLGITVRGPARDIAEQIAAIPDITYVLTGTGRFDVIAAADTSGETSLLRTIEQIRVLRGVNRVQSWRHLQIVKESYPRITQLDRRQNAPAPPSSLPCHGTRSSSRYRLITECAVSCQPGACAARPTPHAVSARNARSYPSAKDELIQMTVTEPGLPASATSDVLEPGCPDGRLLALRCLGIPQMITRAPVSRRRALARRLAAFCARIRPGNTAELASLVLYLGEEIDRRERMLDAALRATAEVPGERVPARH